MLGEYFRLALIAALGILLIAAAITDLRARIISNRLNLGVAALAPLWWIACGLPLWPGMAVQLLVGLLVWAPQDLLISLQAHVWPHVVVDAVALFAMIPPLLYLWRKDAA